MKIVMIKADLSNKEVQIKQISIKKKTYFP